MNARMKWLIVGLISFITPWILVVGYFFGQENGIQYIRRQAVVNGHAKWEWDIDGSPVFQWTTPCRDKDWMKWPQPKASDKDDI